MKFNDSQLYILKHKYLREGESPGDMFRRVANCIAQAEEPDFRELFADQVHEILNNGEALFAGRVLFAADDVDKMQESALTMLNCFSLIPDDSLVDIFETLSDAAQILASGGGVGYNVSNLRPNGFPAGSRSGTASGPVSFMTIYDVAAEQIRQGSRRGACMAILEAWHPDIEEFIECKKQEGTLAMMNVSVGLDADFFRVLKQDGEWLLSFPRNEGEVTRKLPARELLMKIAEGVHCNGEPGVVFLDNVNEGNPTPHLGPLRVTNPCAEAVLRHKEACDLGSINLSQFVLNPYTSSATIDYDRLVFVVEVMVHALDHILDVSYYPLDKQGDSSIHDCVLKTRKIGLGIMGLHDMLIKLGVAYESEEGISSAQEVMSFINRIARAKSEQLAGDYGPFPAWNDRLGYPARRNAVLTCCAPTGTISMVHNVSSGVEPYFARQYTKRVIDGEDQLVTISPLLEYAAAHVRTLADVSKLALFKCATEISPTAHIRMLVAIQSVTDNSVSKTVNCPPETSVEQIADLILEAHAQGCKCITFYRTGSREEEILVSTSIPSEGVIEQKQEQPVAPPEQVPMMKPRPDVLPGTTYRVPTPVGTLYATVTLEDGKPFEIFLTIGKAGADVAADAEGMGRLISLLLRHGVPVDQVIGQLKDIAGSVQLGLGPERVRSLPDAVAKVLSNHSTTTPSVVAATGRYCSVCGNHLVPNGSCLLCITCGFSTCE